MIIKRAMYRKKKGNDEYNQVSVGIWGRRYLRYIRLNQPDLYKELRTNGKLNSRVADIDKQAQNRFFELVEQFSQKEGATEKLRDRDGLTWVLLMNSIKSRAERIVLQEFIYAKSF